MTDRMRWISTHIEDADTRYAEITAAYNDLINCIKRYIPEKYRDQ